MTTTWRRNFHEAFALYEQVLATDPEASASVRSRWAVSLALALAEDGFDEPLDPDVAGRLLARAIDVLRKTSEPIVGQVLGGLLAERAGQLTDAGPHLCRCCGHALGAAAGGSSAASAWPSFADRPFRRVRELYKVTPTAPARGHVDDRPARRVEDAADGAFQGARAQRHDRNTRGRGDGVSLPAVGGMAGRSCTG